MITLIGMAVQAITLAMVIKILFNDLRHIDYKLDELERIIKKHGCRRQDDGNLG